MKQLKLLVLLGLSLLAVGCATQQPYDYSALKASNPTSILVLPPTNDTVEVNAPYTYLSTISSPLAEKGYYVFPVSVVDEYMKQNGLPTPAEMNAVPLEKLHQVTGTDAVLYTHITEWGQKYEVLQSRAVVRAQLKLVDARTGTTLWESIAWAQNNSGDGGAGLVGMLVTAAVNQVVGSLVDQTHDLSSQANRLAISRVNFGLLDGPYKRSEAE